MATNPEIQIFSNGFNFTDHTTQDTGVIYEEDCFHYLIDNIGYGFVVGPGPTNKILNDACYLRDSVKPDAFLILDEGDIPHLTTLFEFKSGKLHQAKKLQGFANLLGELRKNSLCMTLGLSRISQKYQLHTLLPRFEGLQIPEYNKAISIIFLSPLLIGRERDYVDERTGFRVIEIGLGLNQSQEAQHQQVGEGIPQTFSL